MGDQDSNDSDDIDCTQIVSESDCLSELEDNGDSLCAYNAIQQNCYSIVRSRGERGNGNFDDGFNAALITQEDTNKLETLIAVFGAIIVVLVFVIIVGVYLAYHTKNDQHQGYDDTLQMGDIEIH